MKITARFRATLTVVCAVMSVAPTLKVAEAGEPVSTASVGQLKVMCGRGLIPLAFEGNMTGSFDFLSNKVSFSGKAVHAAMCIYPTDKLGVPQIDLKTLPPGSYSASSTINWDGVRLECANDELALMLQGSAEGKLKTTKGQVLLHGDDNEVFACLPVRES